jgi:tRNA A-37 threonylcarbamoyl transferase component Bud32
MGLCPECLVKVGFRSGIETESEPGGASGFVPPTVQELGKLFPQLEIISLLGKGGMGAVYKARQKQLNRLVALKILPPGVGAEPAFAQRFTREAQALAQLNHPGIVTLYEFGQAAEMPFFLMEFVDGVNLAQAMANDRISPREALSVVPQICDALQFAHDQGIVHRDIKPENILLDRHGRVKVADFGVALLVSRGAEVAGNVDGLSGSATLTEAGKIVGTPRYMSPEQLERPGAVDHRADIYALGVVFYQMLTGELPGKKIEPPSRKVHLDVRLDEVVLRALERKPERRFQHASELKSSVETIVGVAGPAAANGAAARGFSRRFVVGWALGILAVVVAIIVAFALRPTGLERSPMPETLDTAAQTIRNEIGRRLREAGATYEDLRVSIAEKTESATPFRVSYSGLRNFRGVDGTTPQADGSFTMRYIGGGQ